MAMLLIAAITLVGVFRLARQVANSSVAIASVLCTALYPVFFAQSSLAHLDLAAACLILWGLAFYLDSRRFPAIVLFTLACLTKETAALVPLALFAWSIVEPAFRANRQFKTCHSDPELSEGEESAFATDHRSSTIDLSLPGSPSITCAPDMSSAVRSSSATTSLKPSIPCASSPPSCCAFGICSAT
jgi:hypothetical protein